MTKIYVIALSISGTNSDTLARNSKMHKKKKKDLKLQKVGVSTSIEKVLTDIEAHLHSLVPMIDLFASQFTKATVDLAPQGGLPDIAVAHTGNTCKRWYFTALEFLREPLSELINSKHEDILSGFKGVQFSNIHNAFQLFRPHFHYY